MADIEVIENETVVEVTDSPEIVVEVGDGMVLPEWGMIGGDIENQGDLMEELDALGEAINDKADSDDVTAALALKADKAAVYTKQETDAALALKADIADLGALAGKDQAAWSTDISGIPSAFPPESHNHDERYYTETEIDAALTGKSDVGHNHDTAYAALNHNHDGRYYTKSEIDTALTDKADVIVCEASGNPVSVSDGSASPVCGLSVGVEPVQDLNGYDHPWPAGGGKNLWNGSNGYWAAADGAWSKATAALNYQSSQKFMVSEGDVFYVSPADNPGIAYVMTWLNGTYVGFVNGPVSICQPYTVPAGVDEIAFDLNFGSQEAALAAKVMMNRGSTPESYEPYANVCPISGWTGAILTVNGTSVLVSFPTAAGMVYGGTLDVTNGVLTVDRAMVDMGTLTWTRNTTQTTNVYRFISNTFAQNAKLPANNSYIVQTQSTIYTPDSIDRIYSGVSKNGAIGVSAQATLQCRNDIYTDAATFKTAMNGVQFVFELAAPIMYQLTPMEVRTVLGNNVISADCGPVTLRYRADTKLYIDGKFAELNV